MMFIGWFVIDCRDSHQLYNCQLIVNSCFHDVEWLLRIVKRLSWCFLMIKDGQWWVVLGMVTVTHKTSTHISLLDHYCMSRQAIIIVHGSPFGIAHIARVTVYVFTSRILSRAFDVELLPNHPNMVISCQQLHLQSTAGPAGAEFSSWCL